MKQCWFVFLVLSLGSHTFAQDDRDQSIQNDFQSYVNTESARNYSGSFLPIFSGKENTVGNRYLFHRWVKGNIVNLNGDTIADGSFVFNYDKITRKLLATQDNKTVLEVNDSTLSSFTLMYDGIEVVFQRMPLISKAEFLVPLVESDNGYSLYKKIITRFQKANFTTNGLIQSGKNYDEYVDEPDYYLVYPANKEFRQLQPNRKAIKEIFKPKMAAVRRYYSEHSGEAFDENYLTGLIIFLNQ